VNDEREPQIGDLCFVNYNETGREIVYRIEEEKVTSLRWSYKQVKAVPVFSFRNETLKGRRPRWIRTHSVQVVSLLDLCNMYANLGTFIADEKKRLSGDE
jgi:hypothetical protein